MKLDSTRKLFFAILGVIIGSKLFDIFEFLKSLFG